MRCAAKSAQGAGIAGQGVRRTSIEPLALLDIVLWVAIGPADPGASGGQRLLLDRVELGLRDRALVEQLLGVAATLYESGGVRHASSANGLTLRYLNPLSTARVTITASGPRRSASRCAPTTFAPVEMPAKMPSSRESRSVISTASSSPIGSR